MSYSIVGNNDGPLRIANSLLETDAPLPLFIGCQNRPGPDTQKKMEALPIRSFYGFDEKGLIDILKGHPVDVLINCFANFKFRELLSGYQCYNIHPSLLPSYKGRHPMHWALINGETETGISIHKMTSQIDEGPVFWQKTVSIYETDSVRDLRDRLLGTLTRDIHEFISELVKGDIAPIPKRSIPPSYFPPRKPSDSQLIEWGQADTIFRKVMALRDGDYPAYIPFQNGDKLKVRFASWHKKETEETGKMEIIRIEDRRILISFNDGRQMWLEGNEMTKHDYQKIQWHRPADSAN